MPIYGSAVNAKVRISNKAPSAKEYKEGTFMKNLWICFTLTTSINPMKSLVITIGQPSHSK